MIDTLIVALLAVAGLSAIGVIAATVQRYGRSAFALREALAASECERELRFTIRDTTLRLAGARVIRPAFGASRPPLHQAAPFRAAA